MDVDIHIYDKSELAGGGECFLAPLRTVEILLELQDNDERYRPVEVGASRHFEADQNLARAAKEFNLTWIARKQRDDGVGIWDGTEFTVRLPAISSAITAQFS